jgi:type VI secretion system protein ImpL
MSQDVTKFLDKIDEIKEFLKNYINEKNDVPTFDFNIDFRVNREKEEAANLIVEWHIKTNDMTKIDNHNKARNGQWRYGEKIEIGLRWPEGIAAKPSKDLSQPFMNVDGQQVTFKYTGRWALLWLLKTQKAPNSERTAKEDADSYLLKYTVPMGSSSRSVGYIKVALVAPVKGKTAAKPMKVPVGFPNEAPNMPQEVINVAEQSVLTDGIVEAVEDEPNSHVSTSDKKTETQAASVIKEENKKPPETPAV